MSLERLRSIVLAEAAEQAAETVRTAEQRRREDLGEARRRAAEIVAEARAAGEADARAEAARRTAAARRRGRSLVLQARRELYDDLLRQALAAAGELRNDPGYPALLERLEHAAHADLGADAVIELDPGGAGGLVARSGTRIVDYSLPVLVERCVRALETRVEELWR